MKILLLALTLTVSAPAAFAGDVPEASAQDAGQEETSAVADRLATSMFFRGELADMIIDAGIEGRFVDMGGIETNAGAKSALLAWIRKNPAKAAAVYLDLKGGGGAVHDSLETRRTTWEFNPAFIAAIKALNAAAGSSSVSKETLESAARRLYEGQQPEGEGPGGAVGGGNSGGNKFFSINYADYRLNKAGLEREVSQAGSWLGTVRGAGEAEKAGVAYTAAFSVYSDLVVAASELKGRDAVTESESRNLEVMRLKLRSAMAVVSLRSRISALADAGASLEKLGAAPGAKELRKSVDRLKDELGSYSARIEGGGVTLGGLGKIVNPAENDFAALYLKYSVYDGLVTLEKRVSGSGFSCLYDYAVYRYLSAFFPAAAYPRARAELKGAGTGLGAALLKAGSGDAAGAMAGLDLARLKAAADLVSSASSFNRGAQFFSWGLLFRPVEFKVSAREGRAVFRPAFTFLELTMKKKPAESQAR